MPGARIASGDRVTLRTSEREDIPFLQRAHANPDIRFPLGTPVRTQAEMEEWFEDGESEGDHFLVCLDEAGPGEPGEDEVERIGQVSVTGVEWGRPDLAYWVVPEAQGQGYAKEAVSLVIDHVFRAYEHPAVGAVAFEFNEASRGLLESLGFTEEGRLRRDRFVDGGYVDVVQYGLLREEWRDAE